MGNSKFDQSCIMLSIDEYKYLMSSGTVNVDKSRYFAFPLKASLIEAVKNKAPQVSKNLDDYVLAVLESHYESFSVTKVKHFYALTQTSAETLFLEYYCGEPDPKNSIDLDDKITIFSLDELNFFDTEDSLLISKNRIFKKSTNKQIVFTKLISRSPTIGIESRFYVITLLHGQASLKGTCALLHKNNILSRYSINEYAKEFLQYDVFDTAFDKLWKSWVAEQTVKDDATKAEMLKVIIERKLSIDKFNDDCRDFKPHNFVSIFPTEEEFAKISDYVNSFVYGWKAALSTFFRKSFALASKSLLVANKNEFAEKYWIKNLKRNLDDIKDAKSDVCILYGDFFNVAKELDKKIRDIPGSDAIAPICFLAVVLQYSNRAVRFSEFILDDFVKDIRVLRAETNDSWCVKAIMLVAMSLKGDVLPRLYLAK